MTQAFELKPALKRRFVRDGLIILRAFVSTNLVQAARRLVEDWNQASFDETAIRQYTQKTFAPELSRHPALMNVYRKSGLAALCAALVRPDAMQPVSTVQIQIRVPEDSLSTTQPDKSMHVDGVSCPHLDPKELRTFTLLVGVLLSEVNQKDAGALRYLPRAHNDMANWFRREWVIGKTDQVPPDIESKAGVPFVGAPGDVIIMHHLIPHAVSSNKTAKPRIMLYFRVKHEQHEQHKLAALRNPWLEFPILRELSQLDSVAKEETT